MTFLSSLRLRTTGQVIRATSTKSRGKRILATFMTLSEGRIRIIIINEKIFNEIFANMLQGFCNEHNCTKMARRVGALIGPHEVLLF